MPSRSSLPVGLTREQIVKEALVIIDTDGLGSLTIRGLARRLNVNPTAIAWHVGTHEQLLSYVVAGALTTGSLADESTSWQEQLAGNARTFRKELHRHPNLALLVGTRLTANAASRIKTYEQLLSVLVASGLSDDDLLDHFDAVLGSIVGFVVLELGRPPDDRQAEWTEVVLEQSQSIDDATYPNLFRVRHSLGEHLCFRSKGGSQMPLDRSFEALLDLLILGIESRVQRPQELFRRDWLNQDIHSSNGFIGQEDNAGAEMF